MYFAARAIWSRLLQAALRRQIPNPGGVPDERVGGEALRQGRHLRQCVHQHEQQLQGVPAECVGLHLCLVPGVTKIFGSA